MSLSIDRFSALSTSMRENGYSEELIRAIQDNFVLKEGHSYSSGDMYAQTLEANTTFFNEITDAMGVIASGEGEPVTIGGLTIEDVNTVSGMTVFTTQLNLVQAQMELINNMFNFVKQFEKSLGSLAGG